MVAASSPHNYIQSDPAIRGGKPRIDGTRITVSDVVLWHVQLAMPLEQIAGDYQLSMASVYAAMAYYYDHREAIDARMAADEALADQLERQYVPPSKLIKTAVNDG